MGLGTILVANTYPEELQARIRALVPTGFELRFATFHGEDIVAEEFGDVDFLIAGGRLVVGEELLGWAPRLRLVHRTGVGYDRIDVAALNSRGIPLVLNPGVNSAAVAEHSILLLLAVLRNLVDADRRTRTGEWPRRQVSADASLLRDLTVGIIGMGHVGRTTARLARAFGANVNYTKRDRLDTRSEEGLGITWQTLDELLSTSDAVILACALTETTRGLIDDLRLSMMRPGSIIINTARGELIDEHALLRALDSGRLRGAGLDVFCEEPAEAHNPLLDHPRTTVTPHVAGLTALSLESMYSGAFKNIAAFTRHGLTAVADLQVST